MGVSKVLAEWTHLSNRTIILDWKYDLSSSSFSKKKINFKVIGTWTQRSLMSSWKEFWICKTWFESQQALSLRSIHLKW